MGKTYVSVDAVFDKNGKMMPKTIIWDDGRKFEIDYILDIRPAASIRSGGWGDRYTISICERLRYLFFERGSTLRGTPVGKWFIEGVG